MVYSPSALLAAQRGASGAATAEAMGVSEAEEGAAPQVEAGGVASLDEASFTKMQRPTPTTCGGTAGGGERHLYSAASLLSLRRGFEKARRGASAVASPGGQKGEGGSSEEPETREAPLQTQTAAEMKSPERAQPEENPKDDSATETAAAEEEAARSLSEGGGACGFRGKKCA